jgi:hypothetical protein
MISSSSLTMHIVLLKFCKVYYATQFVIVNMSSLLLGFLCTGNKALISIVHNTLNWINSERT